MQKINLHNLGSYWEIRPYNDPIFVGHLFRYDTSGSEGTAANELTPTDFVETQCLSDWLTWTFIFFNF